METDNTKFITFLKQLALFHEIESDEEMIEVASRFTHFHIHEDQALYVKGDAPSGVYFVYQGALQALDYDSDTGGLIIQETLFSTDYVGELSALHHTNHTVTLYAIRESQLLHLSIENFEWLISTYPKTKIYFNNSANTRKETRKKTFQWLNQGERIYQICRRHPIRLFRAITVSVVSMLLASLLLAASYMGNRNLLFNRIAWGVLVIAFITTLFYLLWHLFDWRLDMYYVTNQRIQTQEHTWFFIEKMKSTPLHTITGLDLRTDNIINRRILDFGTIRAHTAMDNIQLTDLPNPMQTKSLIQELARRDRIINNEDFDIDLQDSIKDIVSGNYEEPEQVVNSSIESFDLAKPQAHNIFQTRTVADDGTITYHKHWVVLLEKISLPLILIGAFVVLGIVGFQEIIRNVAVDVILLAVVIGGVGFIGSIAWMFYQYADWQNDIYQIRGNYIFDVEKKPLGKEEQNIAEIKNILSARSDKPTIWAKLFNYGDVIMELGKKDLSFNDIQDPLQALSDISERIAEIAKNKKLAAAKQQRQDIKRYINAYHEFNDDFKKLKDEEQDF